MIVKMTESARGLALGLTVGELENLIQRIIDEELQRRGICGTIKAADKIAA